MRSGWHCDGCGDYLLSDGKSSYSARQKELRDNFAQAKALIANVYDLLCANRNGAALEALETWQRTPHPLPREEK